MNKKMVTVIELPPFLSQVGKSIKPEEKNNLIDFLSRNSEAKEEMAEQAALESYAGAAKGKENGVAYGSSIIFITKQHPYFY